MIFAAKKLYWNLRTRIRQLTRRRDSSAVFEGIYRHKLWGEDGASDYYSGSGSHTASVIQPYISEVSRYLSEIKPPVHLVDIGCGDFNVGQHLVPHTTSYTACDVVDGLIERNKQKFAALDVQFKKVDAVRDEIPDGNVVCVRQVLQHLNNKQIDIIIGKLSAFPIWIITEHIPLSDDFRPNDDHKAGSRTRLHVNSGVVLTAPPFSIQPRSEQILCEVDAPLAGRSAVIRTIAYEFGGAF